MYHGTGDPGCWYADLCPATTNGRAGASPTTRTRAGRSGSINRSPHELYDHDGVIEKPSLDLPVGENRAIRKVLVHPERDGHVYVLDRATCQVLSATLSIRSTSSRGVDLNTGRLLANDDRSLGR